MNNLDWKYIELLKSIISDGIIKDTRSGQVKSIFGHQMRINLQGGFPLLTTKKMFYKGIIHELLWFLKGDTNIKYLVDNNVHIWDDDAYRYYKSFCDFTKKDLEHYNILSKDEFISNIKNGNVNKFYDYYGYVLGDLGNVYGKQWRAWKDEKHNKTIDQIESVINTLKTNPDDRRIILSSWNVSDLQTMALPPCHIMCQFYTKEIPLIERIRICKEKKGKSVESKEELDELNVPIRKLSCMFFCRSQDVPLGTPFNIASYALLTHLIAQVCNMVADELIYNGGDCHIYLNQWDGIVEQIGRDPYKYDLPKLWLNPEIKNIDDFKFEDVKILGYESYPQIKMPLSVGMTT